MGVGVGMDTGHVEVVRLRVALVSAERAWHNRAMAQAALDWYAVIMVFEECDGDGSRHFSEMGFLIRAADRDEVGRRARAVAAAEAGSHPDSDGGTMTTRFVAIDSVHFVCSGDPDHGFQLFERYFLDIDSYRAWRRQETTWLDT